MVGEHIRALKAGRWVHAIDCGDETVLHLAEEPEPPRVRRAYRPEFVAGAASVEAVTHRERTFPPDEIVRRAYSRSSDPALAAMFSDSAAFAEWCTSGRVPARAAVAAGPAPRASAGGRAPRPPPARARAAAARRTAPKARPARKRKPARAAAGKARSAPKRSRHGAARRPAPRKSPRHRNGRRR